MLQILHFFRTYYTFDMNFNFNNLNFHNQQSPLSFDPNYFQYIQSCPPAYNSYNYQYLYPNTNFFEYEQNNFSPTILPSSSPIDNVGQIKPITIIKKGKKKIKKQKPKEKPQLQSKQLHYFDPDEAPLITSLRTKHQIQAQRSHFKTKESMQSESQIDVNNLEGSFQFQKLSKLILSEPNESDYPFIILKNLIKKQRKRRYSIQFFIQRADCILNNRQIPLQLQPKYIQKKNAEKLSLNRGITGEAIDQLQEEYEDSLSFSDQVNSKQQQNYLSNLRSYQGLRAIQSLSKKHHVKVQEQFGAKLGEL